MGTRGPKAAPLAIVKDMSPATQSRRNNSMQHKRAAPKCPEELSDRAKKEWDYIVKVLDSYGVIGKEDKAVLAEYCAEYALWIEMQEKLKSKGDMTFKTETGYQQQCPEVGIMHKAADRMMKAAVQLGLTPSARSGININNGGGDDAENLFD